MRNNAPLLQFINRHIGYPALAKWAENEIHGTFEPFRIQLSSVAENVFVPILYQIPAFDAFDDFSDFVESITCRTLESCQVRGSNPCRGATFRFTYLPMFVYESC